MNSVLQLALTECDKPGTVGTSPLTQMRERRNLMRSAMDAILVAPTRENRDLLQSENRDFEHAKNRITEIDERVAELEYGAQREASAAEARKDMYVPPGIGGAFTSSETYHAGPHSPSFFKDLIHARSGDANAADRLRRNNAENGMETRALGNTNGTGGSGGEFAPPGYLVDEYVKLARPGRVVADRFRHADLPQGISSVNVPRVATGTTVAVQSTQNTALAQTDVTTASLSSGIVTHGGKQVVSRQLLDQSAVPFDRVILEDLAADHARALGTDVITGSGTGGQLRGYLTPASTSVNTWTTTSPTASGFYGRLAQLQGAINGSRFKAPDCVVMHPRRWSWMASFQDGSGRPLVVPTAGGFNSMATRDDPQGVGRVGQLLGMDVFTDANVPTNLGAGANQDVVLMMVSDDIVLWESPLQAESFEAPYADSMGVLYRCFNYSALIPDRYLASLGQITGTGLTPPVFT